MLEECDLIQVVSGSPAWALVAREIDRPVALQVATFAAVEREERFREEGGLVTAWRRLMTRVTDRLDRKALREVDRVFVENRWMEETATRWTEPQKVVLAPPGVDTEFFRPPSGPSTPEPGPILSVARFDDRRKNVRLLFEAYAELCAARDDPPLLVLAGKSGPRPKDWRRAEELGIRHRVRFHERVERSRLAELYRQASLFVLSSSEEGLGIVLLEAMASGLPVVSTATEGAREAVEDGVTGILTPVGDASALFRAMDRLLGDSKLRGRMGSKGRVRAENRYSREAAGRRFLAGYRELLGMGPQDADPTARA
jgi:glycosyltransferase involved in cell wall biosynthesis